MSEIIRAADGTTAATADVSLVLPLPAETLEGVGGSDTASGLTAASAAAAEVALLRTNERVRVPATGATVTTAAAAGALVCSLTIADAAAVCGLRTSEIVRAAVAGALTVADGSEAFAVLAATKGSTMAADDDEDVVAGFRTSDRVRGAGDAAGKEDEAAHLSPAVSVSTTAVAAAVVALFRVNEIDTFGADAAAGESDCNVT